MRKAAAAVLVLAMNGAAFADKIQGVIADWNCVQPMVRDGRAKTFKRDHSCSLGENYSREAYGVITADKKVYKLDDAGRAWVLRLLKGTADKDNLRVIVDGDIDGGTIHVRNMSEL
jgi:hypothetical protein